MMIHLGTNAINAGIPISKSSPGVGVSGNNVQQVTSRPTEVATDKVTISASAKTASDLDLEKYAAPKWIEDFIAPLNIVNSAVASKGGNQWHEQREWFKTDLKQYGEYFGKAYQVAIKSTGAIDGPSYHEMVVNDPAVADRGAVFKEALMGMPGVDALMSRLQVPAVRES